MASDSTARRWRIVDPVCALVLLACVAGHVLHLRDGMALSMPDSQVYMRQAERPLTDSRFWIESVPPLNALWYKAVGAFGNIETKTVSVVPRTEPVLPAAQTALSLLAFTLLALACARTARTRAGRRLLFALPLAASLAPLIAKWNQVVLSESLSMSLFAVFVAAWYLYFRRPSWWALAAIAASAACWAAVRDTNTYTIAMFVPIAALAGVIGARGKAAALCIALVAVFAVGYTVESSTDRRLLSFYNIVGLRILPQSDRVDFFASSGMPKSPALAERSGKWASDDDYAFFKDERLEPFRQWSATHGVTTYMRFLLAHPFYSLSAPAAGIETLLFSLGWAVDMNWMWPHKPLTPWLKGALQWMILLGYGLAILSAIALWRGRRIHDAPWLLVPLGMALLSAPQFWLAWHGDTGGILRHSLTAVVSFLLGSLLLMAAMVDGFLAEANARRVHKERTRMIGWASAALPLAVAAWLIAVHLNNPGYVGRGEDLYRQLKNRPPLQTASNWNIHAIANGPEDLASEDDGGGTTLIYTKEPCTGTDLDTPFFLHVWPKEATNLPLQSLAYGFANHDFSCIGRCWLLDERCIATVHLPDYPIDQVRTGQYQVVDGRMQSIWTVEEKLRRRPAGRVQGKFTLQADEGKLTLQTDTRRAE